MKCERCGKDDLCSTGSYFNTQIICPACDDLERAHPLFAAALAAETQAVKNGDMNFPGIGLPDDLKRASKR